MNMLEQLQTQFNRLEKDDSLSSFRSLSWQKFCEMGLPTKSHEAFRYVSLRDLYNASFEAPTGQEIDPSDAILPECKQAYIVFVDGVFKPHLSNVPQAILLEVAIHSKASFLKHYLTRAIKEESDPFTLLNFSLHSQGAFFYLPPKVNLGTIQCLHVITENKPQVLTPRLHIVAGAHSQMSWVWTTHSLHTETSHLILPAVEISLEEGAHLQVWNMHDAPSSWTFESVRASVKKNASFRLFSSTTGAKTVRQSYRVQLDGENAEADLSGLWMLSGNRTAHTHATIDHRAPHTRSMQLFKGIVRDASQSSFEGKILVQQEAQKTEAYQLNNNLILSPGAVANSKPNLEVFADDVKASHGATFSQLDQDQIFYLTTRGIDPHVAKHLLIGGFCREMVNKISIPSLLHKMQDRIKTFLNEGVL